MLETLPAKYAITIWINGTDLHRKVVVHLLIKPKSSSAKGKILKVFLDGVCNVTAIGSIEKMVYSPVSTRSDLQHYPSVSESIKGKRWR